MPLPPSFTRRPVLPLASVYPDLAEEAFLESLAVELNYLNFLVWP